MRNHGLILKRRLNAMYSAPARIIVGSFLLIILLGAILLSLPVSSKEGVATKFIDSLFTSTSATCITGLAIFDTYTKWTVFGQLIILTLIQLGGIGIVTISIFFYVMGGKKLGLRGQHLAKESINVTEVEGLADLFKFIIKTTFLIEFIGAVILSFVFVNKYGVVKGIYISVFLSVSAFCNAGFDILGFESQFGSLINYNDNPIVIFTMGTLIILGGLGFIVWYDLFSNLKHRKLLLHTKVVLFMTIILVLGVATIFFILEYSNPLTLKNLSFIEKIDAAFFQSVNLRTAGFSSIDVSNLRQITKVMSLIVMFIGGGPGSTSGGIKVTTLAILIMTVISVMKNRSDTVIFKHKVHKGIVYRSVSMLFISIVVVFVGSVLLYCSIRSDEAMSITDFIYEAISTFVTVGYSTGIAKSAGIFGRLILMVIMFIGRVGPISLLLSLAVKNTEDSHKVFPEGKIMVT